MLLVQSYFAYQWRLSEIFLSQKLNKISCNLENFDNYYSDLSQVTANERFDSYLYQNLMYLLFFYCSFLISFIKKELVLLWALWLGSFLKQWKKIYVKIITNQL